MVLPAMALVYLCFAKPPIIKRIGHLLFAGIVAVVSTFWWSVMVWLAPAASRPWVGSTNDNSIWSLIFGYNGFGRLLGNGAGGGMGGMGAGFGGQTGILRMFNSDFGPNIAWLLLAAIIGGGLMLWLLHRTPRDNRGRAAIVFWLLWLITHMIIFSITSGTIHSYYVIVMAPAVAALVGISLPFLWVTYQRRRPCAIWLPVAILATTVVAVTILSYTSAFPWTRWLIGITGMVATITLLINLFISIRQLMIGGVVSAIVATTIGPISYSLATVGVSHNGSLPTAGPSSMSQPSNNEAGQSDMALTKYLLANQGSAKWIVAVNSANESAPIQLSTGQPVMSIGGFNGSDNSLTLEQFKQLVTEGQVKYYAVSSRGRSGGPGGNSQIVQWVQQYGVKVEYGGSDVVLYQLTN